MSHPDIRNATPFAVAALFMADEQGVPQCVPVVRATFTIGAGGKLAYANEQLPVDAAGEPRGDPALASWKYEPEIAFVKPATDVVLIGHAHAPAPNTTSLQVGIRVGPLQKLVQVIGDRLLVARSGQAAVSPPRPFERIPLVYERAFGGWDRRDPREPNHRCERRNPVGRGFRYGEPGADEAHPMPNIEDPQDPFRGYGHTPAPAGFGFISAEWQPRASYAGTYDEKWTANRAPLLPTDFDRRFFNSASPGLVAPGYLRGDESVVTLNASPEGRLEFRLPGVPPPVCELYLRGRRAVQVQTVLDTVVINLDERVLLLTWRACHAVRNGPPDLEAMRVSPIVSSVAGAA